MDKEKRNYSLQSIRAGDNSTGEKIIEGHAAVFGQVAKIGDSFYEVIERGAFPEPFRRLVSAFLAEKGGFLFCWHNYCFSCRKNNKSSQMRGTFIFFVTFVAK